jgi:hypothetical protein
LIAGMGKYKGFRALGDRRQRAPNCVVKGKVDEAIVGGGGHHVHSKQQVTSPTSTLHVPVFLFQLHVIIFLMFCAKLYSRKYTLSGAINRADDAIDKFFWNKILQVLFWTSCSFVM